MIIKNIGKIYGIAENLSSALRGNAMDQVGHIENAWLRIDGTKFSEWGTMETLPADIESSTEIIDAKGGWVFPSFCDSHTHIVYAGSREQEFEDKIHGRSYEEIARRGGGILNSADRLFNTTEDELFRQSMVRVREVEKMGTGCIEIKSGYGDRKSVV